MATLYALTGNLLQIQQMIEDGIDLGDTLESVELEIADKLEGYAMVIKNIESDVIGIKAEEKRLAERRKRMESEIQRMKDAMSSTLDLVEEDKKGAKRVKTEKFTFSFRKSKQLIVDDVEALPTSLVEIKYTPNKTEIKKAIEGGMQLENVRFVENKSLSIR